MSETRPGPGPIVVAFGGNALQREGEHGSVYEMRRNVRSALAAIEPLVRSGQPLCITHGNGPQVGNMLLRGEAAADEVPPHPLDIAVATTQGEIGSLIAVELDALLRQWQVQRGVVTLVTHVRVAADDPALRCPTKPIGPFYSYDDAVRLELSHGWRLVEDAGRGYRRVVGSPHPIEVIEAAAIGTLIDSGTVVVAAGGGGIPVADDPAATSARRIGVEAVIDKDRTAALLAIDVCARQLVILTAVDCVYRDFGTASQRRIGEIAAGEARALLAEGAFPAGSMGPKIGAAAAFAERSGCPALITSDAVLAEALAGSAGTLVVP